MANAAEFTAAIKTAAMQAMEAGKPADVCFGKVIGIAPLKILVDQKMILGELQLVLCRNVTDFQTEVTVDWQSEYKSGGSGDDAFSSHNHAILGRKKIIVHNGLVVGDKVILIREQGGQKFIVVDRIG